MDNDIKNTASRCTECQNHLLQYKSTPSRPFQELAADFCQHVGRHYHCLTDWPTTIPMGRQISAKHLLAALTELFSHRGCMVSRGGSRISEEGVLAGTI